MNEVPCCLGVVAESTAADFCVADLVISSAVHEQGAQLDERAALHVARFN
jgi:hypothetical protein